MENNYYITNDQLRFLEHHYKTMFDMVVNDIKGLSIKENKDIKRRFELVKIYTTLRDQHLSMLSLITDIGYQRISNEIVKP
jgi:hypothetical protein